MSTTKSRRISCVDSCSVRDTARHAVVSGVVTVDGQFDRSNVVALSH